MSATIEFTLDGQEIQATPGQTILEAAEQAHVYIPRLCYLKGLQPHGSCRVCTVLVNGRPMAACTQPVSPGMVVESDTPKVTALRRNLIEMLFVEGNHYCMFCEKSGNCELQALAYRFGITAPKYPYLFPQRDVDASHPEILLERNRCILCGRCVRASRDVDGKHVFDFVGRGPHKRVAVNAAARLADTNAGGGDRAVTCCPVGSILKKGTAYATPVGQRLYDHQPIGADIEGNGTQKAR
jgi:[NiFe] hydrogenase diaphorase moiety small subunit